MAAKKGRGTKKKSVARKQPAAKKKAARKPAAKKPARKKTANKAAPKPAAKRRAVKKAAPARKAAPRKKTAPKRKTAPTKKAAPPKAAAAPVVPKPVTAADVGLISDDTPTVDMSLYDLMLPKKKGPPRRPIERKPEPVMTPSVRVRTEDEDTLDTKIPEAPGEQVTPPVGTQIPAAAYPTMPPAPAAVASSTQASGADRREYLRVPYGAWVNVNTSTRQVFCLARDISIGGMFLKAPDPPALAEELRLVIVIENDPDPLELRGLVVRRSEGEQGFGVRFLGLDSKGAARLRDIVADAAAAVRPDEQPDSRTPPQPPRDDS